MVEEKRSRATHEEDVELENKKRSVSVNFTFQPHLQDGCEHN